MADRLGAEITFDPHVFTRQSERNFDLDFVEETIRKGIIITEKSQSPAKFCYELYHGKERRTYVVIAEHHPDFIEVKTVWLRQGR